MDINKAKEAVAKLMKRDDTENPRSKFSPVNSLKTYRDTDADVDADMTGVSSVQRNQLIQETKPKK